MPAVRSDSDSSSSDSSESPVRAVRNGGHERAVCDMSPSVPLVAFLDRAPCDAFQKRQALALCTKAGFRVLGDFVGADIRDFEGVEGLAAPLKRAITRLPAFMAARAAKRQRGRGIS